MPIHDNLTNTEMGAISHALRTLDHRIEPVLDVLEGLKRMAPPIAMGLEEEFAALPKLRDELNRRWGHYQANKEWRNGEGSTLQLTHARASGRALTEK